MDLWIPGILFDYLKLEGIIEYVRGMTQRPRERPTAKGTARIATAKGTAKATAKGTANV